MAEQVGAVVTGAGRGGLAAAVTAASQGKRTLVLEQADTPGGYVMRFQRGPYRWRLASWRLKWRSQRVSTGGAIKRLARRSRA